MVGRRLVESQKKNSLRISAVCQVRRTVGAVSTSIKLQKLSSRYVHSAIFKDLSLITS